MIYVDDSIMRKGEPATAGSEILRNFIAPFDATAVSRLPGEKESVRLAEFGLGDPGRLPDGLLLCNDVFGHVRRRASQQGLCSLRPTYGTVSRFGLIPTASSMDQIGIVAKDPAEGFAVLRMIAGPDPKDGACAPSGPEPAPAGTGTIGRGLELPYAGVYEQVLHILAYAEISGSISRYDGVKFGFRASGYKGLEELYAKTRTQGLGPEAKLAAVVGCAVLSEEYHAKTYEKAMKVRRLIKEALPFDRFDVIELPVESPLAVLCGLPSLTVGGTQYAARAGCEETLLKAVTA